LKQQFAEENNNNPADTQVRAQNSDTLHVLRNLYSTDLYGISRRNAPSLIPK
jgi:hypothetical protein